MKKGGNDDDQDHLRNTELIKELINEDFIRFNPLRDIYNVTFTFPIDAKDAVNSYIKHNGKDALVELIVEEVMKKCRNAEVK